MLFLMLTFSGCGEVIGGAPSDIGKIMDQFLGEKPELTSVPIPPNSSSPPVPSPDQINLDIYWDATVSMQGFTQLESGNVYCTLPDKLGVLLNGETKFFYFGEQITPMEGRDHLKLRNPEFYTESITSFGRVLDEAKTENLSIVVTDLFESESDWSNITQKLREKYFNNHLAVAMIGIQNPFSGKIYDVGLNAASFSYESGNDPSQFRPFYLFLMGSDAQIRKFLEKWKEQNLPKDHIIVFSEYFTQPKILSVADAKNSKNIFGSNRLQKTDNRLQEIGIANMEEDVKLSIPVEFSLVSDNCEIKNENNDSIFQKNVKIFALNEGTWQEQNNEVSKVEFTDNNADKKYNYDLTLEFQPKVTLSPGHIGLVQIQIIIPQENITIPQWINDWDMGNIVITPENFNGAKTVNLKNIAESLRGSMFATTQPQIVELDLVVDRRSG